MRNAKPSVALGLILALGGLLPGCSSGAHSVASRPHESSPPASLAQATCWDTMSCCIQRHPATAAQSCGATALEIAEALNGARVLNEATQTEEASEAAMEREDRTPPWKQQCIETYNQCIDDGWVGTWACIDCFRYCEGQRKWPTDKCFEPED